MIAAWFGAKGIFGLARGWWLVIVLAALVATYQIGRGALDQVIDNAKDAGATEQREGDLRKMLNRTEEANAARVEIRNPGSIAAYNQCVRTARTPANCQRFLPEH